ncbi:hypothetical protein [Rhodococcus sp. 105337]|uniref:hypothetical protein n=1 Tax=Rhodococcus sp. 105337 TaxID=2725310 RepID=UPI00146AFECF|nr:hypothetical protein [Rhodococcus sp. 105337]NME81485.1 hypothetical protein [Rhodococcus sp. 105337]
MPNLLPPQIVGEMSTLNTFVVVDNQQAGTTLRIWANGTTEIGTKVDSLGGRDQVPIAPLFLPLAVGTMVTATQEDVGGPPSEPSPEAMIIQPVSSPLNDAQLLGTIYTCVSSVRVGGATPGAEFEVHQRGSGGIGSGVMLGQGETYNGLAEVELVTGVTDKNRVVLRQIAGGDISEHRYPMPIIDVPMTPDRQLLPLTIKEAPDCGWYVDIAGTINGVATHVLRERGGTSVEFTGYGRDEQTRFWVPEPFRAGDIVYADHRMGRRCEIESSDPSTKYEVQPRLIHPPLIVPPVCLDAEELELLNIEPGADYAVYVNFKTAAGDRQQLVGRGTFPVKDPKPSIYINRIGAEPDQLPGTLPHLTITQTACGWTSQPSPAVAMEPLGASTAPKLPDRILACAVYIRVVDVRPGSWVSIHSTMRGGQLGGNPAELLAGRIGRGKAQTSEISVYVPYGMIEGDSVWACATGCQDTISHSAATTVETDRGVLQAAIVEPVYPLDTTVFVRNLTVGARVIARVIGRDHPGGQKLVTSDAWAPETPVFVGQLFEGDTITVFQSLCHADASENQSNTVPVVLGTMSASIAPSTVYASATSNLIATSTDSARNQALVTGDVLINGTKVGQTNKSFAWTAAGTGTSATVQITAAGYKPWSGSITLMPKLITPPDPIQIGSGSKSGGSQPASYSYTCEPLTSGVKFSVTGQNFPKDAGTTVTIMPQFDGIFTSFGTTHICGMDSPEDGSQTFPVDANGKFTGTVIVRYGCQPTCSVRVVLSCNKLMPSQITDPGGPYCKCG